MSVPEQRARRFAELKGLQATEWGPKSWMVSLVPLGVEATMEFYCGRSCLSAADNVTIGSHLLLSIADTLRQVLDELPGEGEVAG